jgi:molybdopterin/thiamine biosynthesis adenylyltransferase
MRGFDIRPPYKLIPEGNGAYIFFGDGKAFRVADPAFQVLIPLLDGEGGQIPDHARSLLKELLELGLLCRRWTASGIDKSQAQRFDRVLTFLAGYEVPGNNRRQMFNRLRQARVMILGLGSLASGVIQNLAATGVGTLVGVDDDHVNVSNLSRQSLFLERHVGLKKVEAVKDVVVGLSRFTDFIGASQRITSTRDVCQLIERFHPSLVVLTADKPSWRIAGWCAEAARNCKVPLLRGNQLGVGPFMSSDDVACPMCEWPLLVRQFPNARYIIEELDRFPRTLGVLSTRLSRAGSVVADEVVRFLTNYEPPKSVNCRIKLTADGLSCQLEPIIKASDCPVCSNNGPFR